MSIVKANGYVRTREEDANKKAQNDVYLVPDKEESKKLWKEGKGDLRGHAVAWESKFARENPLQSEIDQLALLDPITGKHKTPPQILDNKKDERLLKNRAYSLARTKEGWVVITYLINGTKHVFLDSTKPEHKQFALARIARLLQAEVT